MEASKQEISVVLRYGYPEGPPRINVAIAMVISATTTVHDVLEECSTVLSNSADITEVPLCLGLTPLWQTPTVCLSKDDSGERQLLEVCRPNRGAASSDVASSALGGQVPRLFLSHDEDPEGKNSVKPDLPLACAGSWSTMPQGFWEGPKWVRLASKTPGYTPSSTTRGTQSSSSSSGGQWMPAEGSLSRHPVAQNSTQSSEASTCTTAGQADLSDFGDFAVAAPADQRPKMALGTFSVEQLQDHDLLIGATGGNPNMGGARPSASLPRITLTVGWQMAPGDFETLWKNQGAYEQVSLRDLKRNPSMASVLQSLTRQGFFQVAVATTKAYLAGGVLGGDVLMAEITVTATHYAAVLKANSINVQMLPAFRQLYIDAMSGIAIIS